LIVQGGWSGHDPAGVAEVFKNILVSEGFEVEVSDSLESFSDSEKLKELHLIIPVWTMGELKNEYANNVAGAVESGVGLAGCHGGMCDAFRNNTTWQFLTGSQWVAHPGNSGVEYTVNIKKNSSSPIIEGLDDFSVKSEQYYIHIDPAVNVLASTKFPVAGGPHAANGAVDVPVVYTKLWGKGRVFYNSLGHNSAVFNIPEASRLMRNGFLWASRKDENI
jgi:type 1 glutamine amidotransferase